MIRSGILTLLFLMFWCLASAEASSSGVDLAMECSNVDIESYPYDKNCSLDDWQQKQDAIDAFIEHFKSEGLCSSDKMQALLCNGGFIKYTEIYKTEMKGQESLISIDFSPFNVIREGPVYLIAKFFLVSREVVIQFSAGAQKPRLRSPRDYLPGRQLPDQDLEFVLESVLKKHSEYISNYLSNDGE